MDSRTYVFIYPLRTNADIPDDFPREFRTRPFDAGVFLPQDDSNWFTRAPKYPARVLLLEGRSFHIVPHPTSGQRPVEISLHDLLQIESGTVLLHGWLRFTTQDGVQEIVYNTRGSRALEKFLLLLRQRWLTILPISENAHTELYGNELDIKFRNSLYFELDHDERALVQYFGPPLRTEKTIFLFRRVKWQPGNVVLLTSMNRLLWITDEYNGRQELYASISFSAAAAYFRSAMLENVEDSRYLTLAFAFGNMWRMAIHNVNEEVLRFQKRLNELCGRQG